MSELILSDITRRRQRFCVIGLQPTETGFASIRPLPRVGDAWPTFPYLRGQKLRLPLMTIPTVRPHVESRRATGVHEIVGSVSAAELVRALKLAEVAERRDELFSTPLRQDSACGAAYVQPGSGERSICGCVPKSLRFSLRFFDRDKKIRAGLELQSGEKLYSLSLADRDYFELIDGALGENPDQQKRQSVEDNLNQVMCPRLLQHDLLFARVGVAGPWAPRGQNEQRCWLMLDSLFPLPDNSWLDEIPE